MFCLGFCVIFPPCSLPFPVISTSSLVSAILSTYFSGL
jgi:hypothetical protein